MLDIYFESNYGKLYESHEKGKSEVFEHNSSHGTIRTMFIKREIPIKTDDGQTYYDIITPYGYGGPTITKLKDESSKRVLKEEFVSEFKRYCNNNNIVSEFVRFHPITENAYEFMDIYNPSFIRKTVGTTISTEEDPMSNEFSRSTRKTIRRKLRKGVTYNIIEKPDNMDNFKEIYYSTMDRASASDYYYFEQDYFDKCLRYFKDNIVLVEVLYEDKVIAMSLNFVSNSRMHVHLSGTLTDYLNLSPAYIIKYGTAMWASENNIEIIHYGGGTTNKEDDSLYLFKKRFTKETLFKFYVGSKIWNDKIYDELCKNQNIDPNIDFFPAYRFNNKL